MERTPPDIAVLVIDAFGGLADFSRALGHRHPSTAFGWKKSGIPHWRRAEIVAAAERTGVTLPEEFSAAPPPGEPTPGEVAA